MSKPKRKSGVFVTPGDRLGVIEEFSPGPGTYVRQGTIYAKITGRSLIDLLNKEVSVYPVIRTAVVPRTGSIVIGQVAQTQNQTANISITKIGKRALNGEFTGVLHISDASPVYQESMFDVCKTGDIVRAKVVSEANRTFHLSTALDRMLGVIYAFCSNCGHMLQWRRTKMRCPNCGRIENRKVASDYGKGEI
ncbi:MAG: exosome complex RNA-binding protein Csl4 [Candidatus Bathyarchaeia archaeon]|jgi:exosome complex component CSL4|nr:exosome complex RNA-binding protein Csl4 [Candidatus Bathyarchaeota archaeon A05DMB-4]MDH7595279.1 exosome complex RNA-binding protein Csl4 [Candidatus Bathyarchaeota archaeon]